MKPEEFGSVEYFKNKLAAEENNIHFFVGFMDAFLSPAEGTPTEILKRCRNLMKAFNENRNVTK